MCKRYWLRCPNANNGTCQNDKEQNVGLPGSEWLLGILYIYMLPCEGWDTNTKICHGIGIEELAIPGPPPGVPDNLICDHCMLQLWLPNNPTASQWWIGCQRVLLMNFIRDQCRSYVKYSDDQAELSRQEQAQLDQQREAERARQQESGTERSNQMRAGESNRTQKSSSRPSNQLVSNTSDRRFRDASPHDLGRGRSSNMDTTSLNVSRGSGSSKRATSSNDGHFRQASRGGFRRRDKEDLAMYSLSTGTSNDTRSRSADPEGRELAAPSRKNRKQREQEQQR